MSILDNIKRIFRFKATQNQDEGLVHDTVVQEVESVEAVQVPSVRLVEEPTTILKNQPDWLINEDILRDEGVIFGLSGSNPEEKISIIRNYFTQQTADTEKLIEYREEKIGELNYWINEKEDLVKDAERKIVELKNKEFDEQHHLPRTIIGITLAIGIAVGNYFLIEESLRGHFEQNKLIALGVFGAGMFNLFGRISFLHDDARQSTWRKVLEEIGMPLAAAFFVFAQIYQTQPPLNAWALLVFIFFLFMFSGKLLLGNLTILKDDLSIFQKRNQLEKDKIKKVAEWETEIANHKSETEKFRSEKQAVLLELSKYIAERTRFHAQRDMLIKVFESEYHLALNYRSKASAKDISRILGEEPSSQL
ncbi:MFS transporter [Flectobacillus major]|uniref:MFS transporter n=1 Tax=Flectobacillus major TaxID=103 RepID=UPI0003F9846F|nr:MFS transporter [Flectobacillus major]